MTRITEITIEDFAIKLWSIWAMNNPYCTLSIIDE